MKAIGNLKKQQNLRKDQILHLADLAPAPIANILREAPLEFPIQFGISICTTKVPVSGAFYIYARFWNSSGYFVTVLILFVTVLIWFRLPTLLLLTPATAYYANISCTLILWLWPFVYVCVLHYDLLQIQKALKRNEQKRFINWLIYWLISSSPRMRCTLSFNTFRGASSCGEDYPLQQSVERMSINLFTIICRLKAGSVLAFFLNYYIATEYTKLSDSVNFWVKMSKCR